MDDQDRAGAVVGFFDDETGLDDFFTPAPTMAARKSVPVGLKKAKPQHYKVVSISLYLQDIERLNGLVEAMKLRGYSRMNKSLLIREALRQIDLDLIPPQR